MTLKAKIFAAASVNTELQALLGTNPFRLYDIQLPQQSAFPAVVMFQVSNPPAYVIGGRLSTSWARIQFTVFGTGNDSENASAVVDALQDFLKTFTAYGNLSRSGSYDNRIVNDRDAGIAQTQPLTYQRILDVLIFSNDQL
jgi:hypothetical protein